MYDRKFFYSRREKNLRIIIALKRNGMNYRSIFFEIFRRTKIKSLVKWQQIWSSKIRGNEKLIKKRGF